MRRSIRMLRLAMAFLPLLVQGCALPDRAPAVPADRTQAAEVPGIPNARFWMQLDTTAFQAEAINLIERERAWRARSGHRGPLPAIHFLAISGGGDSGAFGAGLLNGWTTSGTRPTFNIVTGVSTGALTAPFAFLGPDYDRALEEVYAEITPQDVFVRRSFLAALFNDAAADTEPLRKTIERFVTPEFLAKIAAEYDKGRALLVGTHDLDAGQPTVWNLTAIAASGHPRARERFCDVLLASAAIPGVFPPVMMDVEVDGRRHQEMHVDGGTSTQVFVYPPSLRIAEKTRRLGVDRERRLYVIRNSPENPDWLETQRRALPIAARAISALISSQGMGDLYRIYLLAKRDGLDYNLAIIPPEFQAPRTEPFDPVYMRSLFDFAYERAVAGYPWAKKPPGWVPGLATTAPVAVARNAKAPPAPTWR